MTTGSDAVPLRKKFLWKVGAILAVCAAVVFAGFLLRKRHERRVKLAKLGAILAKDRSPLFPVRENRAATKHLAFAASPERETKLSEYDNPLQAAELFREQRVAPQNRKPGTGPIPYAKYVAAFSRILRMPQFSTAMGRPLPSRAHLAAIGQFSFTASSFVQNETQPSARSVISGDWKPLGPGNVGGRTRALVINPSDPNTMYAAAASGGVWKSSDGGGNWAPIADFLANIAVNSLAMDPSNPAVFYAGTGEGYFNVDATRGQGVFKTTDGGTHWQQLAATQTDDFYYVRKIAISPGDAKRIYAATATGLLRSDDSGDHWRRVLDERPILGCLDIAVQKAAPNHVLVSCGTFAPGVIFMSTDSETDQPWQEAWKVPSMGRTSLAIAPSRQNTIYALSSSIGTGQFNNGLLGVFRSDANGDVGSWQTMVDNSTQNPVSRLLLTNPVQAVYADCFGKEKDIYLNQGWYDNTIAVDPKDPEIVWAGGTDLFRSNNGGRDWGVASYWWFTPGQDPGHAHADHHVIAFHPQFDGNTNQTMFVGNDGGVFETVNARAAVGTTLDAVCGNVPSDAVQWAVRSGNYAVTQFYSGALRQHGASYFGGTQDNGTVMGTDGDGPGKWSTIQGGDGGFVEVDPKNEQVIYTSFPGPAIRKSTDGGTNFVDANAGLCTCGDPCEKQGAACSVFPFITPFVMDRLDSRVLWTGGTRMFRTSDGAASWQPASAPFSAANYPGEEQTDSGLLSAIAINPKNSNVVLAGFAPSEDLGSGGGWIHRTDAAGAGDANTVWPRIRPRAGWVSSLAFDHKNSDVAYATYSSFNSDDGKDKGHVFKSGDGGKSWSVIDGQGPQALPDIPVHSVVVDPLDSGRLYIGTDLGIFMSLDGGKTWKVENSGFPNVVVQHLVFVDGTPARLYAFTHGRGLWRVDVKR